MTKVLSAEELEAVGALAVLNLLTIRAKRMTYEQLLEEIEVQRKYAESKFDHKT